MSADDARGPERERTLSDDPAQRSADAAIRRSDERIRHADPRVRAELRRRRRRVNRVYLGLFALLALALVSYLALYFLPLLAVRSVEVTGDSSVGQDVIAQRAGVATGTPLLQVDTHQVARRVAGIPSVSEVTVRRAYPSTLRIEVVERTALVAIPGEDGQTHLVDRSGVDFSRDPAPPGTPVLTVGPTSRERLPQLVRDLAGILDELRGTTGQTVTAVDAQTPAAIVVTLGDGRKVEWGSPGRDHEKAVALAAVLGRPGAVWNVANPAMPTSR